MCVVWCEREWTCPRICTLQCVFVCVCARPTVVCSLEPRVVRASIAVLCVFRVDVCVCGVSRNAQGAEVCNISGDTGVGKAQTR